LFEEKAFLNANEAKKKKKKKGGLSTRQKGVGGRGSIQQHPIALYAGAGPPETNKKKPKGRREGGPFGGGEMTRKEKDNVRRRREEKSVHPGEKDEHHGRELEIKERGKPTCHEEIGRGEEKKRS